MANKSSDLKKVKNVNIDTQNCVYIIKFLSILITLNCPSKNHMKKIKFETYKTVKNFFFSIPNHSN